MSWPLLILLDAGLLLPCPSTCILHVMEAALLSWVWLLSSIASDKHRPSVMLCLQVGWSSLCWAPWQDLGCLHLSPRFPEFQGSSLGSLKWADLSEQDHSFYTWWASLRSLWCPFLCWNAPGKWWEESASVELSRLQEDIWALGALANTDSRNNLPLDTKSMNWDHMHIYIYKSCKALAVWSWLPLGLQTLLTDVTDTSIYFTSAKHIFESQTMKCNRVPCFQIGL